MFFLFCRVQLRGQSEDAGSVQSFTASAQFLYLSRTNERFYPKNKTLFLQSFIYLDVSMNMYHVVCFTICLLVDYMLHPHDLSIVLLKIK